MQPDSAGPKALAPVDLPAVANRKRQHDQASVLDIANYAIVSNAVTPEAGTSAFQRFTEVARILAAVNPLVKPIENSALNLLIELSHLLFRNGRDLNGPAQALS